MKLRWVLVGLGIALGTIAGGASALDGNVIVAADEGPDEIEPGGEAGTWPLTVTYTSATPLVEELRVDLEPEVDSTGLEPSVEPSSLAFRPEDTEPGPGPYTYEADATLTVSADRLAPAYVAEQVAVEPEAHGGQLQDPEENANHVTVVPSFAPGLAADAENGTLALDANEEGHATVDLDNRANGDTRVTLEDVQAPDGCQVDPISEELVLPRARSDELVQHVTCPADADGETLSLTFRQAYAYDSSVDSTTSTATWTLDVEDATTIQSALAPTGDGGGLGPVLGLAALGLAGAAIARQRE
jgi:hypothetical protein